MRIKSFVIALALIMTMLFSVNVCAFDVREEAPLSFISQLKITDGIDFVNPDRRITRAEFTAMTVRAMNIGVSHQNNGCFEDVVEETLFSDEIYTAKNYGLVNGTDSASFLPLGTITYGAALKMIVTSLGYSQRAIIEGGYPTGYMLVASNLKLLKGTSGDFNSKITVSDAARLIYNALFTEIYSAIGVGKNGLTYASHHGKTFLTENFGFTQISGVVNTAGSLSLIPNINRIEKGIGISDTLLKTDSEDIEKYLGLSCSAWYDAENMMLGAIEATKSNSSVTLEAEDIYGYSDNSLVAFNGSNRIRYNISKGYIFVLNGRAVSATDNDFVFESGTLTLIDNDGNGMYDVVLVKRAEYFVISSINDNTFTLYDKNIRSESITLKNSETSAYSLKLLDSETQELKKINFEDLKIDMTVIIHSSTDKSVTDILVSDKVVSGKILENGPDDMLIDDVRYKKNAYFKKTSGDIKSGMYGEFLIAADNTVTYARSLLATEAPYGYFLDYTENSESFSSTPKMRILTSNNKIVDFNLCNKVTIDGVLTKTDSSNRLKELFMNGENPRYQLIRYGVDENGEINMLDLEENVSRSVSHDDIFNKYDTRTEGNNSLKRMLTKTTVYNTNNMGAPYFSFAGATIFEIPSELQTAETGGKRYDDTMFGVINSSSFEGSVCADAYDYRPDFSAGAVVLYRTMMTSAQTVRMTPPTSGQSSYIVEQVVKSIDEDGAITKKVYMCGAEGYVSYNISSEYYDTLVASNRIPESGDVVRFVLSPDGEIICISRDAVFDGDRVTINYGIDSIKKSVVYTFTYVSGNVFSKTDAGFSLLADNMPPETSYTAVGSEGLTAWRFYSENTVIVYNCKTKTARRGTIADIIDTTSIGFDKASYVCARVNYLNSRIMFVYEKEGV